MDQLLSGTGLLDSFVAAMPLAATNLLDPAFWISALQVAIGLGFVIFVHELGHFLVAKACGVKCEKFYIGFDFFDLKIGNIVILPRALFKYKWGETEYGLGIIPLGGYVKMLGQDDNPANAEQELERTRVYNDGAVTNAGDGEDESHVPSGDLPPEPTSDTPPKYELDPRSYTAKTVPQRMAIISAGVIMNLIFAVIFAAIAHGPGVQYTPTIVGAVQPGSPAYAAGILPGDYIIRLHGGERSLQHRWERELRMGFALSGGEKVPVTVGRGAGTGPDSSGKGEFAEEIDLVLVPEKADPEMPVATIGVLPATDLVVSPFTLKGGSHPATEQAGFQAGDRIVRVKGPFGELEPKSGTEFERLLANHPDQTLTVVVSRLPEESANDDQAQPIEAEVVLPPTPMKTLGLTMKMLPVDGVQKDSPAAAAGVKEGDVLFSFEGEPVVDPASLDEAALALAQANPGQAATLVVEREGKLEILTIVPRERTQRNVISMPTISANIDAMGISVPVDQEVVAVDPAGPAGKVDLRPGDRIVAFAFDIDEAKQKEYAEDDVEFDTKKRDLDYPNSWTYIDAVVQEQMAPEVRLKLWRKRGDAVAEVTLEPAIVEGRFQSDRGVSLEALERVRVAEGPIDAIRLGVRETWEGIVMVAFTLQKLVTGGVSVTALGGPLTIVHAAKSQADQGVPRFLIFLTLLSANLAVMNFLPIPVLDGGHMMFLIFEGIRGKPLNEKWQMGLTVAGLFMVMGLMVGVMALDITRYYAYWMS